jgi:thiamine transporter
MIEAAFFAAIAMVLDLLPAIHVTPAVSISFAMVPIFIIAFRWGFKMSFIAGFIWGLLQVVTGDIYFLTIVQFLIEYFIAFGFIGFAGLFYPVIQKVVRQGNKKAAALWIIAAVFAGSVARYFWHFVAGVIFWGEYAPEGTSPFMYSLIVNGGTMIGAAVLCSIVLMLLLSASKRLFVRNDATAAASEPPVQ